MLVFFWIFLFLDPVFMYLLQRAAVYEYDKCRSYSALKLVVNWKELLRGREALGLTTAVEPGDHYELAFWLPVLFDSCASGHCTSRDISFKP